MSVAWPRGVSHWCPLSSTNTHTAGTTSGSLSGGTSPRCAQRLGTGATRRSTRCRAGPTTRRVIYPCTVRSTHGNHTHAPLQFVESGWAEKQAFLAPLAAVPGIPSPSAAWLAFAGSLNETLAALVPQRPDVAPGPSGYVPLPDPQGAFLTCGRFSALLGADGSLACVPRLRARAFVCPPLTRLSSYACCRSLVDDQKAWEWVAPDGPGLGAFLYQTYTLAAFDSFNEGEAHKNGCSLPKPCAPPPVPAAGYNPGCGPPCHDFSKRGMVSAAPVNASWTPSIVAAWLRPGPG